MDFTQNIIANTLLHTYTQLIVLKTRFPNTDLLTKKNFCFYLYWLESYKLNKVKLAY